MLLAAARGDPDGPPVGRKDGDVLAVDPESGLVYVNLGSRHGVRPGMRFAVWLVKRDLGAEVVALVRVVATEDTHCKTRVERRYDGRAAPAEGMWVSNPFYDPRAPRRVCLAGDMPLCGAAAVRRAAETAGAEVVPGPEDGANVVVLGSPPVRTVDDPRRAALLAEAWRRDVLAWAEAAGALVVAEQDVELYAFGP
mgnify:CR=1 FL=1